MSDWKAEKKWSDQFIPEIKSVLGQYLIGEAPVEEDALRNTDLITLSMAPMRIACRVRREKHYMEGDRRNEFTFRTKVPSGNKTELEKVMEGWGDYFFYGFGGDDKRLIGWTICNLAMYRHWANEMARRFNCRVCGNTYPNGDGTWFEAFNWSQIPGVISLPKPFIVAQHLPATWQDRKAL